jgi:hypothetical protein
VAYWITTHWPVENSARAFSRHVYVKDHYKTVPGPGDIVFVRESATVNGKRTDTMEWRHLGKTAQVKVGPGYGGIIGRMVVVGNRPRPISNEDAVYQYGDLSEWEIIDCKGFTPLRLSRTDLRRVLDCEGLLFTRLWRVTEPSLSRLLAEVGK